MSQTKIHHSQINKYFKKKKKTKKTKKEPRVSNRDLSGLTDGGAYLSEARAGNYTQACAADRRQDIRALLTSGGGEEKGLPVLGN